MTNSAGKTGVPAVQYPPQVVRAIELQQSYWTDNADEQLQLEQRGVDSITWPERLRLHHLNCLQRIARRGDLSQSDEMCKQLLRLLLASDSPYRPRPAMIWQGQSAQANAGREPDLQGEFLNPSLSHLGCLEVYRLDATNQPKTLDFLSFDEMSGVVFAPTSLLRPAKVFCDGRAGEIVFLPMLYGTTWTIGNDYDRSGQMTRFVAQLKWEGLGKLGASGIGVGQQDLAIINTDGGCTLFGLGSVAEISFPLDMRDPRFDEKARARGIDPDDVRRQMGTA